MNEARSPAAEPLGFARVLVTGGGGFVGRYLVPALRARLAADAILITTRSADADAEPGSVKLDLTDAGSIEAAVRAVEPDLVIHLAGQASVAGGTAASANTWRVNAVGTLAFAESVARVTPTATFLFTSSSEIYGRAFLDGMVTEATPPRPASVYGQSKLVAEQMLDSVLPGEARLIVARPSNHIGPGQDDRFVVASFARQIAEAKAGKRDRIVVGNLDAKRDFLDVRDVVAAYLDLLQHSDALPARSTFNVASGAARSIKSILDELLACADVRVSVEVDPARVRPAEVKETLMSADRIKDITGWRPRIAWSTTLAETLHAVA